jgi:hypothetical protein
MDDIHIDPDCIGADTIHAIVQEDFATDAKMSQIKYLMATTLAKQRGKAVIDMKVAVEACDWCVTLSVPHYHLTGMEND